MGRPTDTDESTQTTPSSARERGILVYWQDYVATYKLPSRGSVTVGRSRDCDIQIDHPSVSRRHVSLHVGPADHAITVEDLGSSNGTALNGKRLTPNQPEILPPGAAVEVGLATLLVQGSGQGSAPGALRGSAQPGEVGDQDGHEPTMNRLQRLVDMVAAADISVLLLGETGVGKEVMAETIHRKSKRAANPLVRINCAAMPEALLESELFGYERGAFTGALLAKPGLMESADGGTLFLDEVADLPLAIQAKLLRALETRELQRVGALRPKVVDVRFIAATNADLEARVAARTFRQDLYYRLNGISITLPPLRNRVADIPGLARVFVEQACRQTARPPSPIAPEVIERFATYAWPGNIRELKNVVERAVVVSGGGPLRLVHLPPAVAQGAHESTDKAQSVGSTSPAGLLSDLESIERQRIADALEKCQGNQTKAARLLGISRRMLVGRLDVHGLPRPRKKSD